MLQFQPKREWWCHGNEFLVTVKHYIETPSEFMELNFDEGPNRWNVYCFIYPSHPLFKKFKTVGRSGGWPSICYTFPLHGGVSYFCKYTMDNRKVTSYKVGCDYHHLHDNRFTYMETTEEAKEVFQDAERLHEWLSKYVLP